MKLSIIIPAYNVEQYLERCITSCEHQDIPQEEYEVIIVDDGSKDNTLAVARRLAQEYHNLVVFSQENGGSSKARNAGLKEAKGNYIWFVDADDYIYENCIGRVLSICEENDLDICHFSLSKMKQDGTVEKLHHNSPNNVLLKGRDILLQNADDVVRSACANFYKSKFLDDYQISFTEGITQQDVELNGRAFAVAQRCMFVDDSMYVYVFNCESIRGSNDINKRKKYAGDSARILALRRIFYTERVNDKELQTYFDRFANSCIAGTIRNMIRANVNKEILDEFVNVAKENQLYPIKGKTLSKKWNLITFVVNKPALWFLLKFI